MEFGKDLIEASEIDVGSSAVYENTNGMPMSNGKNLHMEVGPGELANRVITVGSQQRAEKIASFLEECKRIDSHRGFTTITGSYNGTMISVVSIGMGPSMMDFFVRESRAVVEGPMAIIRFGTCGGIAPEALPGSIVVASGGSGYVTRNPDAFSSVFSSGLEGGSKELPYYNFSNIASSDLALSNSLTAELRRVITDPQTPILEGVNVTAESFYSSQGRMDPNFDDQNHSIFESVSDNYSNAKSMEMETFMLLHLAQCSKIPVQASACAIVVANRCSSKVIEGSLLELLEENGGLACIQALVATEL